MDIICAKTGKHFTDMSLLTECQKHCDRCSLKPDIFAHIDEPENKVNESRESSDSLKIELQECPFCHKYSLALNSKTLIFECLNLDCRRLTTKMELEELSKPFSERIKAEEKAQPPKENICTEIDDVLFTKVSENVEDKMNCTVHPEICSRCKKNLDRCVYKNKSGSSGYCRFYDEK